MVISFWSSEWKDWSKIFRKMKGFSNIRCEMFVPLMERILSTEKLLWWLIQREIMRRTRYVHTNRLILHSIQSLFEKKKVIDECVNKMISIMMFVSIWIFIDRRYRPGKNNLLRITRNVVAVDISCKWPH